MGGINIVYQFLTGLYYFLIYPFMVNPNVVGEKFKYYPGFICSCNAGFLLVIYGLFILMAAGSNLTGSTQLGLVLISRSLRYSLGGLNLSSFKGKIVSISHFTYH